MNDCCEAKKKHRTEAELKSLNNRLSRIEGQVRGLKKMLDGEGYCTDIITQVAAVQAALNAFSREILSGHIKTCVIEDIRAGDDAVAEDLIKTMQLLMK